MELQGTGARRETDWIVDAEGEIDGTLYGVALKTNRLVLVKGAGRAFSGMYYVTKVIHHLTHEEYRQRFWARRNGIGLLGGEDFDATEVVEDEPAPQSPGQDRVDTRKTGRVVAP